MTTRSMGFGARTAVVAPPVVLAVALGVGIVARLRGGGARMVTVADAERGAAAPGALLAARER